MPTVHVVSHTHWDREWYHPHERFRQRLVTLVDELLDDPPPPGRAFLLDGQAVILEDYLEVRPERASEVAALLRERRLEAGPWYVLADELIPGGEALVRNLLTGRRVLRTLRADAPPVLYCPDSFGHPATLPELATGFDKPVVVLWRGYGGTRWPRTNVTRWLAPSGQSVLLYHLTPSGYELGANLPAEEAAARRRWTQIRAQFQARGSIGIELLLNGADHHARQRNLDEALALLTSVAAPELVSIGGLSEFAAVVRQRARDAQLPVIRGELRDSYGYTWTLQGTLGSRAPQKRRYVLRERELVRDVEPWAALAAFQYGRSSRHLVRAAWKPLLLCQPHDTLCGCSIDQVARAMDARLESVATQAEGIREQAIFDLLGHDREAARSRIDEWKPLILIRNRAARPRSGVAITDMSIKVRDVTVGPGSAPKEATRLRRKALDEYADAVLTYERTEAPRAYPDNDAVLRFPLALWVRDVPPYGVAPVPLDEMTGASAEPPAADRVRLRGRELSNGKLRLRWNARGRVSLEDLSSGREIVDLVGWDSHVDLGDLYTPSIRGPKLRPRLARTSVVHQGPMVGAVEQLWVLRADKEFVEVRLRFVVEAGAAYLRFGILGDNRARDHRLRIVVRSDVTRGNTVADAAFGRVVRTPLRVPAADARMERPVPTAPLHRYVTVYGARRGATLYSDGCTEYETRDGAFHVTLLRAVGELSRNDLPERPGHAGWPSSTPEAQCIGVFQAEFGILLHGPESPETTAEVEATADDVLFPLTGDTLRSALRLPPPIPGVELRGSGLAFAAAKESEDGDALVLRCVNLLDATATGEWHLHGARPIAAAYKARLDETPDDALECSSTTVPFVAGPREVVTVLVR